MLGPSSGSITSQLRSPVQASARRMENWPGPPRKYLSVRSGGPYSWTHQGPIPMRSA